jgi:tetratricopeptide (TPR) repeat protein
MNNHFLTPRTQCTAVLLVFISIFLVYMNTFQVSWQLDDYPNILNNSSVHLKDLSFHSLKKTFYTSFEGKTSLYRPVSCLTFGLNWYFGKASVHGFHLTNIVFHFLTASILFLTVLKLFQTPQLINKYKKTAYPIALVTTLLWSLHPIQTQAVTYIVQRMSILAALFSILGIYIYIKARLTKHSIKQFLLFFLCFLSFLFALGSKENAAIMPLSLILIEFAFFQPLSISKKQRKYFLIAILSGLILFLIYTLIFMGKDGFVFLFKGYEHRPFTLTQRLMTSPRIIFLYLGQLFFPIPDQLSIAHDIEVSLSLFDPWTTFFSFLCLFILIGTSLLLLRKYRLISFAILFFLVNHIIESTILPLELLFEHRNYLPSLFLFLPVAAYLISGMNHFHRKKTFPYMFFFILTIFMITGFGIGTYSRNTVWLTEESLWQDAMKKYPALAPPYQKLAAVYQSQNQIDIAEKFYLKSLSLKAQRPKQSIVLALNNLGNIYTKKQNYDKAIEFYKSALQIYPENERAKYNLSLALIKQKKWEQAAENIDSLISRQYQNARYQNIKGFILFKQNNYTKALHYLRTALHIAPSYSSVKINMGMALSLMGHHERADWFLNKAYKVSVNDILILFCLVENSVRSGNSEKTELYLEKLCHIFPVNTIANKLKELVHDNSTTPVSVKIIVPVIAKKMRHRSKEIAQLKIIKLMD